MVLAATRWLGIRLDLLSALLIGAVALVAALYSHDNGKQTLTNRSPLLKSSNYPFVTRNSSQVSCIIIIFTYPIRNYFTKMCRLSPLKNILSSVPLILSLLLRRISVYKPRPW